MESQKTKRISWSFNLCQVRQFLSSEPPSKVGMGHLKAKSLGPAQPGIRPANLKLSKIPLTKWRCPPKFELSSEWRVAAGEESKETKARESSVVEAIYPRRSAIPPNPDVEKSSADDLNTTPVVPLTPIEEREADDQRNLIDYNLLAKLLSNPQVVKQLIAIQSAPNNIPSSSTTTRVVPNSKIALNPTASAPPAKDINYCRSLIQQYGGGQREDNIPPHCTERANAANQNHSTVKRPKLN